MWVIIGLGYNFKLAAFLVIAVKCEGCERFLERPQIFSRPCFFVEMLHIPSGFRDVSLCAVTFVARAHTHAIKDGLSMVQCKAKMSFIPCSF